MSATTTPQAAIHIACINALDVIESQGVSDQVIQGSKIPDTLRHSADYNIKTLGKWFNDVYNKRKKLYIYSKRLSLYIYLYI